MVEFLDTLLDAEYELGSGEGPLAACGSADLHTDQLHMIIAFFIVVVASAGICASVNLQKLVHVRNEGPDGQPLKHFTQIPLWWVAMIANTLSELFNLAALGFAPATLVAPLACLTVLFNSLTAVFWLGEPFLRRDLLGLTTMIAGVTLVVLSSTFAPVAPVTPTYIATVVAFSPLPYAYLALIVGGLALLIFCAEKRWASRYSWVYLAEAGLAGSVSTVAARAFSSCLGPPLLGKWSYMCFPPADQYCWVPYVSLVILIASAFWSLVLQNKAMIHFGMSEVVPIFFCMFSVGGVAGAGFVFQEMCYPGVLLLPPGVFLCICGVFAIAYRREKRLARHGAENGGGALSSSLLADEAPDGGHDAAPNAAAAAAAASSRSTSGASAGELGHCAAAADASSRSSGLGLPLSPTLSAHASAVPPVFPVNQLTHFLTTSLSQRSLAGGGSLDDSHIPDAGSRSLFGTPRRRLEGESMPRHTS